MLESLKISIAQKLYPVHVAKSQEEYEAIWAFRYGVYVDELNRHDHPDADHDHRWIRSDSDESDNAYLLYTGTVNQIRGTLKLSLFPLGEIPDNIYEEYSLECFEDIGTRKIAENSFFMFDRSLRGTATATALICRAIELAVELEGEVMFVNCVPGLLRTYQKMGLRTYGGRITDWFNFGMVVPMIALIDLDYLRRIGSPMYHVLKKSQRRGKLVDSDIGPLLQVIEEANGSVESNVTAIKDELHGMAFGNIYGELPSVGRRGGLPLSDSLLTSLSEQVIYKISKASYLIDIAPGDQVIQQDVKDQELYFILDGSLEVRSGDKVLLTRGKGGTIGEIGFLRESGKRSSSVFAVTPSRLLVLRRSFLKRLVKDHPRDACVFYEALSRVMAEHIAEHIPEP